MPIYDLLCSARVTDAKILFFDRPFVKPLHLSTGIIAACTEARVMVSVNIGGRCAQGFGSIYLSDLWAWPDPYKSHGERDTILRKYCRKIASALPEICAGPAHPADLGLLLHNAVVHGDQAIPALALAMCASPFDAAVHDAVGHALGISSFSPYDDDFPLSPDTSVFGGVGETCRAIRKMMLSESRSAFDAWWIVGAGDDLNTTVRLAASGRGIRSFKLKLHGKNADTDARRTAEVYRAAVSWGDKPIRLTVDTNEGNPDADSVGDYLQRLRALDEEAFDALEYLEQPTSRDIGKAAYRWHEVSAVKPVLLDEGLTSLEQLHLAREQGWTGLALKTCKGHSFLLVAAAWAHGMSMPLALQDLTNPGFAAIHSAKFSVR